MTRNKLRSSLTILSVALSLALMTILYGYLAMQEVSRREAAKHDRVVVLNKPGFAAMMPIAHFDKIAKMEGVVAAAIGFVSGVVPAILAARLSVIDGLRRVV